MNKFIIFLILLLASNITYCKFVLNPEEQEYTKPIPTNCVAFSKKKQIEQIGSSRHRDDVAMVYYLFLETPTKHLTTLRVSEQTYNNTKVGDLFPNIPLSRYETFADNHAIYTKINVSEIISMILIVILLTLLWFTKCDKTVF